jgi:DNA-binding NarL/FixJ family response regulator
MLDRACRLFQEFPMVRQEFPMALPGYRADRTLAEAGVRGRLGFPGKARAHNNVPLRVYAKHTTSKCFQARSIVIALVPILALLYRRSENCEDLLRSISVFACESQPIVVEGLQRVLSDCDDLVFSGWAPKAADAIEAIQRVRPDVVLIDGSNGLTSALRLVGNLKAAATVHSVLWVVDLPEMDAFRALQIGARGILKKTLPVSTLLECLREVAAGQIWMQQSEQVTEFLQRKEASRLTPREKEVVRLVCRGLRNKQIAENLHITAGTVKVHLMHIFEKTGLKDRLALAVHGRELAGVEPVMSIIAPPEINGR